MSGNLGQVVGNSLNPNDVEEQRSGVQLLIDGPTPFVIGEASLVDSKKSPGHKNLMLIYNSTDPENPGEMREWLVITNPNKDAEKIGRDKVKWLAQSAGIAEELSDTSQLQGKHVWLDVITRQRDDKPEYNTNQVGRYIPATEWREAPPQRTATEAAPSRAQVATSPAPEASDAPQSNPWVGQR
jgi:hypothetical protein